MHRVKTRVKNKWKINDMSKWSQISRGHISVNTWSPSHRRHWRRRRCLDLDKSRAQSRQCLPDHSSMTTTGQIPPTTASLAPTYLTTDIHLVSEYGRRPLRSSTDRTLTVPRTHNRFGDKSFAVAGPRLWNSLPISLRQISSFGQFRRYLINHLFGI